jgi:hypothetical protein
VTHLFVTTRLGQIIWSFLVTILCLVFIVPIVFHSFYKSVYDFGPKHCKQSFWEILTQPVPGIKFEGHLGKSADFNSLQQHRFNHKPVDCKLQQNKILSSKLITRSTTALVYDCPMTNIDRDAPRLYGYQTYITSNDAYFIGNHMDQSPHTMQMTLYFAICHFSCPDLVFKTIPHHLPGSFIMDGFAISIILVIFRIITIRAWIRLINLSSRQFLQRLILRGMCAHHTKN